MVESHGKDSNNGPSAPHPPLSIRSLSPPVLSSPALPLPLLPPRTSHFSPFPLWSWMDYALSLPLLPSQSCHLPRADTKATMIGAKNSTDNNARAHSRGLQLSLSPSFPPSLPRNRSAGNLSVPTERREPARNRYSFDAHTALDYDALTRLVHFFSIPFSCFIHCCY